MHYLRMIVDWVASLETGRQFRKWASLLLKIFGVSVLVGAIFWGIALFVGAITTSRFLGVSSQTLVVIGAVIGVCINIIAGTILVLLFWNRSKKVRQLGDESHFTLIPIVVVYIQLFGETGFIALIGLGFQALIASIFGSQIPGLENLVLHELPASIGFIGGVISLVVSFFTAVILLIGSYFIAEQINLLSDIATNLKKIEATLSTEETTSNL